MSTIELPVTCEWFPDPDKEAMLRRAFVDDRADFIIVSSRRQVEGILAAAYGVAQGWLTGRLNDDDEQSTYVVYRLTEAGRKHFLEQI